MQKLPLCKGSFFHKKRADLPICPIFLRISVIRSCSGGSCHSEDDHCVDNGKYDADDHTDNGALSARFCAQRESVFPNEVQNETDNRKQEAQKCKSAAARILRLRCILLLPVILLILCLILVLRLILVVLPGILRSVCLSFLRSVYVFLRPSAKRTKFRLIRDFLAAMFAIQFPNSSQNYFIRQRQTTPHFERLIDPANAEAPYPPFTSESARRKAPCLQQWLRGR